jgi:hypothetical protein
MFSFKFKLRGILHVGPSGQPGTPDDLRDGPAAESAKEDKRSLSAMGHTHRETIDGVFSC